MLSFWNFQKILDFGAPGVIVAVIIFLVVVFLLSKAVKVSNVLIGKFLRLLWIAVKWGFTQIALMIIAVRIQKIIFSEGWLDNQVAKIVEMEQFVNSSFWNAIGS